MIGLCTAKGNEHETIEQFGDDKGLDVGAVPGYGRLAAVTRTSTSNWVSPLPRKIPRTGGTS